MNKYFENQDKVETIQHQIDKYLSMVKMLIKKQTELKKTCNHTYKDGKSAITWKGESGPGHITYTCNVCKEYGNRSWASPFLDL